MHPRSSLPLTRRDFLAAAAVASAGRLVPRLFRAQAGGVSPLTADLTLYPGSPGPVLPVRFTGLSYEAAQLVNPAFFSAANRPLIALFRGLGRRGVLRIGGGTSDFTVWSASGAAAAPPYEVFGPDTSKGRKIDRPITPLAIRNLRAFLDAADWDLIYGLNMARGSASAAAEEAAFVQQALGPRLVAFQCGNEPDAWRTRCRPASWNFDDFLAEWIAFSGEIRRRVPGVRFAGPDISNKIPWLLQFAEEARHQVVLLTSHYYAEGPASSSTATIDRLLAPNPRLVAALAQITPAIRAVSLPWRMTEGNSCWDGGKPGVSDTFASALWCADMMLQFARAGCCGVNLHGGGNGCYTPIAGGGHQPLVRRPEYFGMQFAEAFAGATLSGCALHCDSDRVTAYAAMKQNLFLLAVFNKSDAPLALRVRGLPRPSPRRSPLVLAAPEIGSRAGVTLAASAEAACSSHRGAALVQLPAFRGALFRF